MEGRTADVGALAAAAAIERLRAGRSTELTARGVSMRPFLAEGDRILLDPCAAAALRPGDLVAFEREGALIVHRVLSVSRSSGRVLEKGDGLVTVTALRPEQALGRARSVRTDGTRVLLRTGRHRALAPWLARCSALHAFVHRTLGILASRYPSTGLAVGVALVEKAWGALLRGARGVAA